MKQVAILARGEGMTQADFRAHWSIRHAALAVRLPGLVRYVQYDIRHVVPRRHLPALALAIDGIEELWFASAADLETAARSPAARAMQREERSFLRGMSVFTVHEIVVYDVAADAAVRRDKRISILRRRVGMSVAEFQAYWSTVHRELAQAHRHADRYAQNHVVAVHRREELPEMLPDIDGFGDFETADLASMAASYETAGGRALNEDAKRFLAAVSTYVVDMREIPLPVEAA